MGGVITQNLGWRGLFVVLGALNLANFVVPLFTLRGLEWREAKTAPFDVRGSAVWICALSALIIGFSYVPGAVGYGLIAAGVLGLAGFVRVIARHEFSFSRLTKTAVPKAFKPPPFFVRPCS